MRQKKKKPASNSREAAPVQEEAEDKKDIERVLIWTKTASRFKAQKEICYKTCKRSLILKLRGRKTVQNVDISF